MVGLYQNNTWVTIKLIWKLCFGTWKFVLISCLFFPNYLCDTHKYALWRRWVLRHKLCCASQLGSVFLSWKKVMKMKLVVMTFYLVLFDSLLSSYPRVQACQDIWQSNSIAQSPQKSENLPFYPQSKTRMRLKLRWQWFIHDLQETGKKGRCGRRMSLLIPLSHPEVKCGIHFHTSLYFAGFSPYFFLTFLSSTVNYHCFCENW